VILSAPAHTARFRHEALFYAGEEQFLEGTLPFVSTALAEEEPVLVVLRRDRSALLREALGDAAELVRFQDMHQLGRNPARIIPACREFLDQNAADGRGARGIGELIWPDRSQAELAECDRHESLLNLAFDRGQAWRLLCPYDLDGLDEHVIESARRNHPFVTLDGGSRRSERYVNSTASPDPFVGALPAPATDVEALPFGCEQLKTIRSAVATWAAGAMLGSERVERLVLAVNEVASNSVRYGGGGGTLRLWSEPQTLVCEVRDGGRIEQPLAGRIRPTADQHGGRGLWLVNQLCDLVQIRSTPSGTVVRLHMSTL
jgi:anti-sigma regulatory factor (Ser/Thr protein kinase)